MNVFGKNERSWRKARKRGVSPIIATILLVAITVVLAAVLYVLISGLTGGGVGSKPIGSAFSAGSPVTSTCGSGGSQAQAIATSSNGFPCYGSDFIYTLTIESSTVSFGNVLFEVKTSSGAIFTPAAHESFAVVNIAGQVVALSTPGSLAMAGTWSTYPAGTVLDCNGAACSTSSSLTSLYTVVVDMGQTAATTGQGLSFVTLGTGGFTGTTSLALP
jgi:flagellin-like protein